MSKKTTKKSSKKVTVIRRPKTVSKKNAKPPEVKSAELAKAKPDSEKLNKLDVAALQAKYREVIARPTGSENKAYLTWKITQAQKGRIPVGPRKNARREGVTYRVLPLRMESELVDKLDEAWKRLGIKSRMELLRRSIHLYLASEGEGEVAALFASQDN